MCKHETHLSSDAMKQEKISLLVKQRDELKACSKHYEESFTAHKNLLAAFKKNVADFKNEKRKVRVLILL